MASILDGVPEGRILDGLDNWPRYMSQEGWFAITREIIQNVIVDMGLDPEDEELVTEHFRAAGLL
jgi:hypothetical protein